MSTARIPDGTPRGLVQAGLGPDLASVQIEYGLLYSGGSVLVRPEEIADVWPLDDWIMAQQRRGRTILRRAVHVIEDWTEIADRTADAAPQGQL